MYNALAQEQCSIGLEEYAICLPVVSPLAVRLLAVSSIQAGYVFHRTCFLLQYIYPPTPILAYRVVIARFREWDALSKCTSRSTEKQLGHQMRLLNANQMHN
jgi:hypothetical protein